MIGLGFKQSQGDHALFIIHSETGGIIMLLVYVDDIIFTGNDEEGHQLLDIHLSKPTNRPIDPSVKLGKQKKKNIVVD